MLTESSRGNLQIFMMKQLLIILVLGMLTASAAKRGPAALAQDYAAVARSEDPKHVFFVRPK